MNKWMIACLVALFFLWIIYLRMQKDEENIRKRKEQIDEEAKK